MPKALYFRSAAVLSSLWGIVFAAFAVIFYALSYASGGNFIFAGIAMSPWLIAILFALGFVFLQFLISPWIMDLQLRWIYDFNWINPEMLPSEMKNALFTIMQKYNFTVKKVGLIHDDNPNAFTYGRFRNDSRLVITQGIIDLLEPDERVAVLSHEMGHIIHYDFVFMTIAQAVPLLMYMIYISSRSFMQTTGKVSSNRQGGGYVTAAFGAVMIISYIAYFLSGYIVLFLSRIRELFADQFSALETGNPNSLSSSLVKIAYGLVLADAKTQQQLKSKEVDSKQKRQLMRRNGMAYGMRAMGIADIKTSKGLVMQSVTSETEVDPNAVAAAASWDLVNPWASFLELSSTHPLTGKRLKALDELAFDMHKEAKYPNLGKIRPPESLYDEFFVDLFFYYVLPSLVILVPIIFIVLSLITGYSLTLGAGVGLLVVAALWYYRVQLKYPGSIKNFHDPNKPANTVLEALTSMEKDSYYEASPLRGKSIAVEGIVMGRGTPGMYFSEDFVVRDSTGFIRIDYSSAIPFGNLFFALKRINEMMGQKVRVVGWYHRGIAPYIQLDKAYRMDGKTHKNHWRELNLLFIAILAIIGVYLIYI